MTTKNMQLKYFFIFTFFILTSTTIYAQRNLKYKNVYKTVVEGSKSEAYSLLLVFQKQEPYFANTYLQLGLIAENWAKEYDALVERKDVDFFIYNTSLYFGLAKSKIDDKEIRKNQKYYQNIGRFKDLQKIKSEDVNGFLTDKIVANNEYKKNVDIVTNFFNSSIKHYNNCIRIFKGINQKNNKIKDIYLTADDEFMKKLNELESSFDSTLYFLQNYQTAIKNYPIKNYKQEYKLLPIETYRLHGLTGSDFLLDLIPIWDYGTWIKKIRKLIKSDLFQMKNEIDITEKALNRDIERIGKMENYSFGIERYIIDEKLKYQIGKYDHNSLILDLFKYKDRKLDYLVSTKNPLNNTENNTNNFPFAQKARYYNSLFKLNNEIDSLNTYFRSNLNEYDVNKYKDFFETNYGGFEGLKNYSTEESKKIKLSLDNSYKNLKQSLINDVLLTEDTTLFTYKKSIISLKESDVDFDKAVIRSYYTKKVIQDSYGDYYITGFTRLNSKSVYAFVAKTNKKINIDWVKTFYIDKFSKNYGSFLHANENGCNLLITSIKGGVIKNALINIDIEGKQKKKTDLSTGLIPIYFKYDEINENYLIGYKGSKYSSTNSNNLEKFLLKKYGSDLKPKWYTRFDLKGDLVDVLKVNNNFFVIMNFTEIKYNNKTLTSKATGNTNSIISVLNTNGKVIDELALYNTNAYFIKKAIKINSKTINLLGFEGENVKINNSNKESFGKLNYILINDEPKMIFNNWKK